MKFETARGIIHAWQCDHMGHANLRAYGEFFEQALWQLFYHLGLTPTALRGEIRMAGVQQNISYRKELLAGDLIFVLSQLAEISERKLRMEHELLNVESNELCATASSPPCALTPPPVNRVPSRRK